MRTHPQSERFQLTISVSAVLSDACDHQRLCLCHDTDYRIAVYKWIHLSPNMLCQRSSLDNCGLQWWERRAFNSNVFALDNSDASEELSPPQMILRQHSLRQLSDDDPSSINIHLFWIECFHWRVLHRKVDGELSSWTPEMSWKQYLLIDAATENCVSTTTDGFVKILHTPSVEQVWEVTRDYETHVQTEIFEQVLCWRAEKQKSSKIEWVKVAQHEFIEFWKEKIAIRKSPQKRRSESL